MINSQSFYQIRYHKHQHKQSIKKSSKKINHKVLDYLKNKKNFKQKIFGRQKSFRFHYNDRNTRYQFFLDNNNNRIYKNTIKARISLINSTDLPYLRYIQRINAEYYRRLSSIPSAIELVPKSYIKHGYLTYITTYGPRRFRPDDYQSFPPNAKLKKYLIPLEEAIFEYIFE